MKSKTGNNLQLQPYRNETRGRINFKKMNTKEERSSTVERISMKVAYMNLIRHVKLLIILCALATFVFTYLDAQIHITPGWTAPTILQEKGTNLSLIAHHDTLWLALEKKVKITIMHSKNGCEWSPPSTFPEEWPQYATEFYSPRWLKRPSGDVWLLWFETSAAPAHDSGIYYACLKEDGTLGPSQLVRPLSEKRYSFCACACTLQGDLVAAELLCSECMFDEYGITSSQMVVTDCVVEKADGKSTQEGFTWERIHTVETSKCIDICIDNGGALWLVYNDYFPKKETSIRTIADSQFWGDTDVIPFGVGKSFLQRRNGQYVFFFIEYHSKVFMMTSPDGDTWSDPMLVARVDSGYGMDVTESDDGTMWAAIDGQNVVYVTKYTDEKYQKDIAELKKIRIHNYLTVLEIVGMTGIAWILFVRSPIYEAGKSGLKKIRNTERIKKKSGHVVLIVTACAAVFAYAYMPDYLLFLPFFVLFVGSLVEYLIFEAESAILTVVIVVILLALSLIYSQI